MKEKPKRLKGTVLFTVVSVMMVMVVFLLGTLALAATASNRAYSNYQKEQTEYTSRAVLDSVVQAIQDDSDIKKAVLGLPVGSGMTITVDAQDGSDPHEVTVTNTGAGHQSYDPKVVNGTQKGAWLDNNEYLLSVTVGKTMAQTTYTAKLAGVVQPTKQTNNPGGAFVSLGDTNKREIATKGYVTGGTYIGVGFAPTVEPYTFSGSGTVTIDAPFYLNGSTVLPTMLVIHYTKAKDFMVITGDVDASNAGVITNFQGFQTKTQMKDGGSDYIYENSPYIYIGGTLKLGSTNKVFGYTGYPFQMYLGGLEMNGGSVQIIGDLYTFNDVVNKWHSGNDSENSRLYKWTASTIKRSDAANAGSEVNGSWYSKGEINISGPNSDFQGDIRCEKGITISGNTTVGGDIVCGGTLRVESGATLQCNGTIYADVLDNKGTIYTLKTPKVRELAEGSNEPTTHDDTQVPPTLITSVKDAYGDIYPDNYEKEYLKNNVLEQPQNTVYSYPSSLEDLGDSIYKKNDGYQVTVYTANNTGNQNDEKTAFEIKGNCVISDKDGAINKNIYINPSPSQPVVVVLDGTKGSGLFKNQHGIIVNDESLVTIFVTGNAKMGASFIITSDYVNMLYGTTDYNEFKTGDKTGATADLTINQAYPKTSTGGYPSEYPNVVIYGAENSVLHFDTPSIVTAQIRAQEMVYEADKGIKLSQTIKYETGDTADDGMKYGAGREPAKFGYDGVSGILKTDTKESDNTYLGLVGQLIARNIVLNSAGEWGMLYVTEGGGTTCTCAKKATCGCTGAPGCSCGCADCKCKSATPTPSGTPTSYQVMGYQYY